MIRIKLSSKILIYFLIVSIVPLVVTNYLLVSTANTQLLKAASAKQQAVANNLSDSVSSYLNNNKNSLNSLARLYSSGALSDKEIDQNISVIINQNSDLKRLATLDDKGQETSVFDEKGNTGTLSNSSNSDAFKAINFLGGKEYVSSVSYADKNNPTVIIAVPIISPEASKAMDKARSLNSKTVLRAGEVKGVLVASYSIKDLWNRVLSTKIGESGYAYVVDGLGNLVAHPDNGFLVANQKLSNVQAVKQFAEGNFDTLESTSETGQKVVSTPTVIPDSGWAVIVQEPTSSVYSNINSYIRLAAMLALAVITIAGMVGIFFSRQITEPIKKLSIGAKKIGSGQFDYKFDIHSHDELQTLASTFNRMGLDINRLVTKLKMNNVRIDNEKTKLSNIINSVSDGIIALDKDGNILSINPPATGLANLENKILIGKKLKDAFEWEQNKAPLTIETTKPGNYEYNDVTLLHSDQEAFLDLVVSVIDHSASEVAAIITIHDLTKSRELDFMKLDFVAIAAHELRTPLTVIRGYMDLLNTEAINELSIFNLENLQKMIRSTNELRDLINKLLNIARIERGEMEIFIEKLNIVKQVAENVHQHQATATNKNQTLTFESSIGSTLYVPADPSSITEVLNNLIGNALKFTPQGGQILVSMSSDEDQVRVEVKDNGPGVPDELHDKLFAKFYRAERSLISGSRGTGLGLFISRTVISLQHGKIDIMPSTGKGSTFYFTLPIYKPELHDKLIIKSNQSGGVHGWFKKNSNS